MKEAVVPSSAADPVNINPPLTESEKIGAFPNQREPIAESWGPAALDERRERTREQLAKIAARRESWINRNKYYYELLTVCSGSWWSLRKGFYRFAAAPAIS